MLVRRVCLAIFLSLSANLAAQTVEGLPIVAVRYVPPNVLDPADVDLIQTLKLGSQLRADDVSEEIDRLFATGEFDDIRADGEAVGGGVAVTFVTKPRRYLASIIMRGNFPDPPTRGELAKVPPLNVGNVFTDQDVNAAVSSMQKMLVANGLYDASVQSDKTLDDSGQQLFLTLQVKPGKRARYGQPEVRGDAKLPVNTIIKATGWRIRIIKRWREMTEARTREGLQGIIQKYQDQDRLRAKVELEKLNYDAEHRRVIPEIAIEPGPKVEIVTTEAKVSKRILKRYVPVFQERSVDNDLLAEGARNLRDYFQSKGYFDTVVDYRTVTQQEDLERIEFAISRGPRFKLVHLELVGNKYFDEETLRERMFLEPASFFLRHGRYSEAFRKKDEENIQNLYRSNGFRDVKVTSERVSNYEGKEDQIAVVVHVSEGPQWLVDSVEMQGIADGDRAVVEKDLTSAVGQPFSEVNIAVDRNYLLNYYSIQGYATADVEGAWQVTGPQRAKVVYQISPGPQHFVREVLVTGAHQTRLKLVEERLNLKAGDPLSPVAQREAQKSLYDMGLFARVDTAIENADGATRRKTVLYALEEANRYTVSLGLGAQLGRFGTPSNTTITSAAGSIGFSPQLSLNVSRLNFLGRGHTVSARAVYSSLQKRGSISYFAPRFQNIEGRSLVVALLYDQTRDIQTFSSRRQEASVQVSQRLSKSTTALFRLAYRRVSVNDVSIPVLLVPQLLQPVRLGIISANLARDRRDNSTDAHRGSYSAFDAAVASKILGSQRSFVRVLGRNATYYRLTRNLTLARQTQFGAIFPYSAPEGISNEQSVPLPERFFGGGADSLRAFAFNQAGPRDTGAPLVPGGPSSQPTGFPLGGNALLFNSVELRFPLIGQNVQGVLISRFWQRLCQS